jgi:predicted flap endonuclease-1-like 5' DNA nuclease
MIEKIKKLIQDDLQRRYEQLEERFLIFEQRIYGRLGDRLDSLENQLDQLSEILRQNASAHSAQEFDKTEAKKPKKQSKSGKKSSSPKKDKKLADDLKKLPGLGTSIEKKLNDEGVFSFKQLAELKESDLDKLNVKIPGFKIRYERYEWKKEAGELI